MSRPRTSRWIRRFGQWVVTVYGIECLTEFYAITVKQIRDSARPGAYTLVQHMAEKNWVCQSEFRRAYEFAVAYYVRGL